MVRPAKNKPLRDGFMRQVRFPGNDQVVDEETDLDGFADMFTAFARGERLKPMLKVGR
jgi:hypothetical protein